MNRLTAKYFFRLTGAFFLLFAAKISFAQSSLNMSLYARWDSDSLPSIYGITYSEIWGYAADDGREYAIIGVLNGTYFFDVTDPRNPVMVRYEPGRETSGISPHREYKTYKHYAYGVTDEKKGSLQVFDLSYLPDSVHKVYDSDILFETAHSLFIDTASGRLYATSTAGRNGLVVLDLAANPETPSLLGFNDLGGMYVHDLYVRNDTAYCSAGNDGLFIYDYKNPLSPLLLATITIYPDKGYNHSSWLSEDGHTLVFADENHGLGVKVFDVSDFSNITLKGIWYSNLLGIQPSDTATKSIPHNPYILGDNVFISYYHDGVQVFSISTPEDPVVEGFYDTCPENTDYIYYRGAWGVYPFLPSHSILASDIANGLYVLDGRSFFPDVQTHTEYELNLFPNPATESLSVTLPESFTGRLTYNLYNAAGMLVQKKTLLNVPGSFSLNMQNVSAGVYLLRVQSEHTVYTKKVVKI